MPQVIFPSPLNINPYAFLLAPMRGVQNKEEGHDRRSSVRQGRYWAVD